MTDSRPSPTTPELDQLREFVRVVVAIYLDNCGGVSGLSALWISACVRRSMCPEQVGGIAVRAEVVRTDAPQVLIDKLTDAA